MSAIGGLVGGVVDAFAGGGDDERKKQDQLYQDAKNAYNYNTHAKDQSGTEFDKMDPTGRNAMMSALGNYESRVNAGGLDAVGRANLEGAKAEAAQTAAQSAAQIQAEAARRGALSGSKAALMQTIAGQQAGEGARRSAFDSAALAEQARNEALKGQVGTAGAIYGMDANRAAAQDAINRFNVMNAQQNIKNDASKAAGVSGVDLSQADVEGKRAEAAAHKYSNLGSAVGGGVASMFPGGAAFEGVSSALKGLSGGGGGGVKTGKMTGAYDPSEGYE